MAATRKNVTPTPEEIEAVARLLAAHWGVRVSLSESRLARDVILAIRRLDAERGLVTKVRA